MTAIREWLNRQDGIGDYWMDELSELLDQVEAKLIDPRHLVGVAEISALFLVGRTTVAMWHTRADRNGFPPLVAQLAMGPLGDVNEVIAWYGSYKPLKGGRPGRVPGADAVPA